VGVSGSERKKGLIGEPADAKFFVNNLLNQHVGSMFIGLITGEQSRVENAKPRCNIIIAL